MQTLYTWDTLDKEVNSAEAVKLLQKHFDQSRQLLIYLIHFFTQIPAYAETDAYKRSAKHLPSEQDLNVNTKIAGSDILWRIKEDALYNEQLAIEKPELRTDKDLVRKFYLQLSDTDEYKRYLTSPTRSPKEEKEIFTFIFEYLVSNELFISHIEEIFINWDDDADMVLQLFKSYLNKPGSLNFREIVDKDKLNFGKDLITTVLEKSEHLSTLIVPKLKNWDAERIALLDMIIMKMGVSEFLFFETIPPKVTINEYIDIAKEYSTQQSGQFVNGILDSIHKELQVEGKLQKTDFKKA
jgi:N utilization substance protein B